MDGDAEGRNWGSGGLSGRKGASLPNFHPVVPFIPPKPCLMTIRLRRTYSVSMHYIHIFITLPCCLTSLSNRKLKLLHSAELSSELPDSIEKKSIFTSQNTGVAGLPLPRLVS